MAVETGTQKLQAQIKKYKAEIEKKNGKTVDQLRDEREKRIYDVLNLRVPDRVPTTMQSGVFACRYAGVPLSSMYYDPITYAEACLKTIVDFEPDTSGSITSGNSGLVNELLDVRSQRWPGGNLPADVPYQFVKKNGQIVDVLLSAIAERDSTGKIIRTLAVMVDVTERKQAEEALKRSNELLEKRVRERTRELHKINKVLESEIDRRKGLEGEILAISDREQQRLGQELHDGLCQHLTAVAFMSRSVAMRLKNHRVIEVGDIEKIAQLVNDAATDTRNLSRALHRLDVDAAGLVNALQDLVDREIWRTPCRLEIKPSFRIEDDAAAAHLYRIAREAVINANKHAQAREIIVRLQRSRREMVLHVIDDGVGLSDERKLKKGLGLHIMNYRAQSAGGHLEIESPKTGGTRVSCYLPVHAPQPKKAPNGEEPIGVAPKLSSVPVAGDRTL